jgi:hypothetical protein
VSEWWTYTLSDFLLFSPRTYLRLIELYHRDLWPLQIAVMVAGIALGVLVARGRARQGRAVAAALALAWLWVGLAFHVQRYATINWAAGYFAAAFVLEALLLGWLGVLRGRLAIAGQRGVVEWLGLALFVLALMGEPLLGRLAGRAWPQVELAGLTPDATALATLGLLLCMRSPVTLLLIPVLWCLVGGAFSWMMEAPDALLLPACAVLGAVALIARRRARGAERTRTTAAERRRPRHTRR